MHYNFAVQWLKAFRDASETVCALYEDDGFVFEDVMLDQHNINTKDDLLRLFAPYANKDPEAGIGIHNFRIRSYIGDERFGLIRWEWSPESAAMFLGLDVTNKPFATQGHTFHMYNDRGHITRESSWWDASAVLRQVGPVSPTKHPAGLAKSGPAPSSETVTPKAGLEHAQQWCRLLGSDTAALGQLYTDYFTLETTMVDDHLEDTITDRTMLAEQLGGLANGENGTYTFEATEYLGDEARGLIHWKVTIEGAATFRGLPTGGKTLTTIGSTFHERDADGRIKLESTYWEDNTIFEQLGVPIMRPHYWVEGFDPASLLG